MTHITTPEHGGHIAVMRSVPFRTLGPYRCNGPSSIEHLSQQVNTRCGTVPHVLPLPETALTDRSSSSLAKKGRCRVLITAKCTAAVAPHSTTLDNATSLTVDESMMGGPLGSCDQAMFGVIATMFSDAASSCRCSSTQDIHKIAVQGKYDCGQNFAAFSDSIWTSCRYVMLLHAWVTTSGERRHLSKAMCNDTILSRHALQRRSLSLATSFRPRILQLVRFVQSSQQNQPLHCMVSRVH